MPESLGTIVYRLGQIESRAASLEARLRDQEEDLSDVKEELAGMRSDLGHAVEALKSLSDTVGTLIRAVIASALSLTTGAILLAVSIWLTR